MPQNYHVRIEKERLVFCAAHFITYGDDVCEPLHGHNYHVAAEVHGPLDENSYVIDFIALRDMLEELVKELDHHMLLPKEHPTIAVEEGKIEVTVTHSNLRWIFPRQDCVLLPVANTTAELLAKYLGDRLLATLSERLGVRPQRLAVEVDECDGQSGIWSWETE
jgi:6-pyruvoyltetrahydropterin/6-carboxytetrahydropterin synthase